MTHRGFNAGDKNDATAAHLLLYLNRNNGSNSARDFVDGMDVTSPAWGAWESISREALVLSTL
ncbi:MAG TPA: hypothetical protein VFP16_01570 [Vicinamibacterales bacterium]|nr:hypothetical protein [Vicinamibacterales bacterium]